MPSIIVDAYVGSAGCKIDLIAEYWITAFEEKIEVLLVSRNEHEKVDSEASSFDFGKVFVLPVGKPSGKVFYQNLRKVFFKSLTNVP